MYTLVYSYLLWGVTHWKKSFLYHFNMDYIALFITDNKRYE